MYSNHPFSGTMLNFRGVPGSTDESLGSRLCLVINFRVARTKETVDLQQHLGECDRRCFGGRSMYIQMSSEKKTGYLLYIRDYTTQLYRDYNKPLYIRIPINQPV